MIGRRGFITGMVSLIAAPAIVRVASIMPVKVMIEPQFYGIALIDRAFLDAAHRQIDPPWLPYPNLPTGWEPYHTAKRVQVFRAHQKWLVSAAN